MTIEPKKKLSKKRLEELKVMVHDERYMAGAIFRLATVLSNQLMDDLGALDGRFKQR
ncbi:hypothetical protein MASR2M29_09410 [Spirochaetota bacterium]